MAPVKELTVGQVAMRSGVAVSTLHFYEARGLIRSHRTAGNQRRYGRDVLRRVAIIRVAQEVGISLAEIGAALESLPEGRTPTREDWKRLVDRLARRPRPQDQPVEEAARRPDRLYRLRLHVDRQMPVAEQGRPAGSPKGAGRKRWLLLR